MSNAKSSWSKWLIFSLTLVALAACGIPALGQEAANTSAQGGGYVDDWSHHHLVFSNPGAREDAVKKGTLEKWLNITNNPRYQLQLQKRSMGTLPMTPDPSLVTVPGSLRGLSERHDPSPIGRHRVVNDPIEKDWSQSLGGSTTSLTSTLAATNTSTTVGSTSTITVGTQTFTTGAPATASLTATIATPLTNGTNISGSSSLVIDGVTFNASPPVAEIGTFTMGAVVPGNLTTLTAAGVTYNFTTATISTTQSANTCGVSVASGLRSTTTGNLVGAMTNGVSGNAKGTSAWECGTISGTTATVTSFSTSAHTITMTASTVGSTGFSYTLGSSGFTFATNTAGSDGTTSAGTSNPETFAYWSGNAPVSSSTLATTIATLVGTTNTTTSAVLTATPNSPVNDITFTAKVAGTGGNAYSVTPNGASFSAFTGGSLTGGTNGPGDTSTTFNYWNGSGYDTGTALATDLHTALAANTTVTTTDGITGTAGTNAITFATTKAGPFPISVQNFSGFTGVGSIGSPATTATVQPNAYPAKYGASLITASCQYDFVVYPTGEAGSATAPTIVAYNNLYSSCTGTVPSVAWAFNTENGMTGYSATTSPILSLDGSKVAFIQSNGTNAYLVVVRLASGGTLASPVAPTIATDITTCGAPCMTVTELSHNDTYSAPFYDYNTAGGDILWVGDNSGKLEQFTGVFNGAVAISGGSWPASLGTAALSSPVLDTVSGYIFVGDMGGTLYSVGSGTEGTTAASVHGTTGVIADAIADAPLIDSVAGTVYVFANESEKTGVYVGYNTMFQFLTGFTSYGGPGVVALWRAGGANGATGHYLYSGDFDNVYYQNTTATGSIYAIGDSGLTTGATLYRVPINNGSLGTVAAPVTGLTTSASGAYPWPSPVVEYCNGACTISGGVTNAGTDYVFFSVNRGAITGCTAAAGNGCIMSYNVSNPAAITLGGAQNYTNDSGTNGCWVTGGIVIDNDASPASGASQIYFTSLNGAEAGEPGTPTSTACSAGSPATINAVQALQSAP